MRKMLSALMQKLRTLSDRFIDWFWARRGWFTFTTSERSLKELCLGPHWWDNQPFANQPGEVRKLRLNISAVPNSFNKTWAEQQKLLKRGEFVPTVRDLVEGLITYQKTRKRIPVGYWVRTGSVFLPRDRISVRFSSGGVDVYYALSDIRGSRLGLLVAQKST